MPELVEDLIEKLEDLRCDRDWTYKQLGDAIEARTQRRRNQDCWRRICQGLIANPHKRTLSMIEAFLEAEREAARRALARRRRLA